MTINIPFSKIFFTSVIFSFVIILTPLAQAEQNDQTIILKQEVHNNPNNPVAYYNLGDMYVKQEEYKMATKALQQAIQINPNYAEAFYLIGRAYGNMDEFKKSRDAFNRAIAINPDYAEAYLKLGVIYYRDGNERKAIENLKRAIEIKPEYAEAYSILGAVYSEKSRSRNKAIDAYEKAVSLDINDVEIYVELGYLYSSLGLWEQAIDAYRNELALRVETIEPNRSADAYCEISGAYLKLFWRSHRRQLMQVLYWKSKLWMATNEQIKRADTSQYDERPMRLFWLNQAVEGYKQEIRIRKGERGQRQVLAIAYNDLSLVFAYMGNWSGFVEAQRKAFLTDPLGFGFHTPVHFVLYYILVVYCLGFGLITLIDFLKSRRRA